MKKPNIKPPPWSVSKYKPTSVLSGERDVIAENLSEKDAQAISAVPEMIDALINARKELITAHKLIGSSCIEDSQFEIEEALEKAGVEF